MFLKGLMFAALAVLLYPIVRTIVVLNYDEHHFKHHPGICRKIARTSLGSEDIQVTSSGLAFITSGILFQQNSPKFKAFSKSKNKGQIEMVDMNTSNIESKALQIKHSKDFNPDTFRPHGISLLEDKAKGEHILYVINHAENQVDRVEKFKYEPATKELKHITSFFSEDFRMINDLAVVAEDKFYISNYQYFQHQLMAAVEQIYKLPLGAILFHNGTGATKVIERLVGPNGVTLSRDQRFLYVASTDGKSVQVYERRSDHNLIQVQEASLHTFVDNMHLSEDGESLLVGCHPIASKITFHILNPVNRAPSQILRLPLKNGLIIEQAVTEEFYDHGDLITGSTVAADRKNKIIIGSIIDSLVLCQQQSR